MKLVEILARDWIEWPINHDGPLAQNAHGGIYIPGSFRVDGFDAGLCMSVKQADDWRIALVARAQWEAERARISVDEAHKWHIGTETEEWRNECQKQYEQELWDGVAVMILEKVTDRADTIYGAATCAADQADAFMAERAKRLKR